MDVLIEYLKNYEGLQELKYQTPHSAAVDLYAAINEVIILSPFKPMLIATGIKIEIPIGYEAQIRPRSGLALQNSITVLNAPGTIDSDYRGEIGVILHNLNKTDYTISRGDRIAQMIIAPAIQVNFVISDQLSTTKRGQGGFGHTGM